MYVCMYVCVYIYHLFIYDVLILCFICITCLPDSCGGQKKASDPPKLELRMVVNHQVG